MTKYQHIEIRHKAAQWFLEKKMHFQNNEIQIQTIKMATNWSSKIMWIEIGELNVLRLQSRANTIKNPEIQLVTFFPATLWQKRKDLNEILKEHKKKVPVFRYQIFVRKNNIQLKTKMLGEYMWLNTPIMEFMNKNHIRRE